MPPSTHAPNLTAVARTCLQRLTGNAGYLLIRYVLKQRRLPNILRPRRFNEKTLCKMLFDRNPVLPLIADKLAVRDYVAERVPWLKMAAILRVYDRASELDLSGLPERFVLKANHGSALIHFAGSKAEADRASLVAMAEGWLATNYGTKMSEWAYKSIQPRLFAEAHLSPDAGSPVDYKLFCFDGRVKYLKVILNLSGENGAECTSRFYTPDWEPIHVEEGQRNFPHGAIARPANLERMIEASERLGDGLDFIRVDLYDVDGEVYFGELTNYHNAAVYRYDPPEFDLTFGAYWQRESMRYLPFQG